MRYSVSIAAISAVLLVFAAGAAVAQTSAPMSKSALRQQDRAECAKQVDQHQANAFLECMASREATRKSAEQKRAEEERAAKRAKATRNFEAAAKGHDDLVKERLALSERERVKRVECRKQASDQKLHFAKRLRFIEKCVAGK
jgi:hypothetical protein